MSPAWSRPARYLALGALLFLLGVFVYSVRPIIGPLVISALLAYLLDPLVQWLSAITKIKRRVAVYVVYFLALAVVPLVPAAIAPSLIAQVNSIEQDVANLSELLISALSELHLFGISPLESIFVDSESYIGQFFHPDQLFGALRAATENVVWVLVILITTYYLLQDWHRLRGWVRGLFPEAQHDDLSRLSDSVSNVWRFFLRGQLASMFLIGLLSGIAAAAIGLPGAVVLALLSAALAVIPSVGSSTMIAVAAIVALFAGSSYLRISPLFFALLTAGVFTAIHLFENYWLRPRILGQRLRLHPGLILVAIIGALTLGGILEALLIVPIISTVDILGRYMLKRILGEDPWVQES